MKKYKLYKNGQYQFKNGCGIYAIINLLNNKKYVGSTKYLRKRYRQHLNDLIQNKHPNCHLQRAVNKYGIDKFAFVILERCQDVFDTLKSLEQKYINTFGDYNICKIAYRPPVNHKGHEISEWHRKLVADLNRNRIWKKESLLKKSLYMKNSEITKKQRKPVLQYDLNGNFIREFSSVQEAAEFTGNKNHRVSIKRCCQGKYKKAYNFKWRYKNDL